MSPAVESALLLVLLPLVVAATVYMLSRLLPWFYAATNQFPPWNGPMPAVGSVWDYGKVQRRVVAVCQTSDMSAVMYEGETGVMVVCPTHHWWDYHKPAKFIRVKRWRGAGEAEARAEFESRFRR